MAKGCACLPGARPCGRRGEGRAEASGKRPAERGRGGEVEDDSVEPGPPWPELVGEEGEGDAADLAVAFDLNGTVPDDGDARANGGERRSSGGRGSIPI